MYNSKSELDAVAYCVKAKRKSMGAGRKDRITYKREWSGAMTQREYLNEFARIDLRGCGLFRCRMEFMEMNSDRWWDCAACRAEVLARYRAKITTIRKECGLSNAEVKEFMRLS